MCFAIVLRVLIKVHDCLHHSVIQVVLEKGVSKSVMVILLCITF